MAWVAGWGRCMVANRGVVVGRGGGVWVRGRGWASTTTCTPPSWASEVAAALNNAHPRNNVPASIKPKVGMGLHLDEAQPLGQLKRRIQTYFEGDAGGTASPGTFRVFDRLSPLVTTAANFDDLLTPPDHVSRRPTDTFYVDEARLLRCHMTAHQTELLRAGNRAFLMVGDVYRRDEVDATHYPIFHQVDGVRVWHASEFGHLSPAATAEAVTADLRRTLLGLAHALFGHVPSKWVDAYFPFTDPSLELEIEFEQRWLEVLGCGNIRAQILSNCGMPDTVGWAFGMGLERLAMVLHGIPDIRLFWSTDPRFTSQFAATAGDPTAPAVKFKPYSKHPACYKDITFWVPPAYHDNDFFQLVREVAGDLVERVQLMDQFTHPKSGRTSHCYRILYRHMDKNLTNEEVDVMQHRLRTLVADPTRLGGELR